MFISLVPFKNAEASLYQPFLSLCLKALLEACILIGFSILVLYEDVLSVTQVQK